jgi:hypothetical protein
MLGRLGVDSSIILKLILGCDSLDQIHLAQNRVW